MWERSRLVAKARQNNSTVAEFFPTQEADQEELTVNRGGEVGEVFDLSFCQFDECQNLGSLESLGEIVIREMPPSLKIDESGCYVLNRFIDVV